MNRFTKFFVLGMTLVLLGALVMPIAAQEGPGQGQGGTIVTSNIGGDPSSFNPILSSDTVTSAITGRLYPSIIGVDPETVTMQPGVDGSLAASWEYDETGTILTITLRQDAFWGDGTQITARDYIWSAEAVRSNATSSPRTTSFYELADGTISGGVIHEIVAIDDFTVQIRLGDVVTDEAGEVVLGEDGKPQLTPNCEAINYVNDWGIPPAHIFEAAFGTDYALMDADPYFVPTGADGSIATFYSWTDPFIEYGVQVSLLADENFTDGQLGYVAPGEWLMVNVANSTVGFERFLAGDFTVNDVPANRQNEFRATAADAGYQVLEYNQNGYQYMALNLADPNNPQPGVDTEGNYVDQGLHPIFGDKLVRQALSHGIDVAAMIGTRPEGDQPGTGILEGNGYAIATHNNPAVSWVQPDVTPPAYDPELAASLLEEAGWVDTDGNGVRECRGCLYAAEVDAAYEGTEMAFELLTNAGNVQREQIGETIRAQLAELGVTVNFQAIEFGTLVGELTGQQFDAIIIGWSLGLPFDPSSIRNVFFGSGADLPGSGFNMTSYQNPEMEAQLKLADTLPAAEDGSYGACDQATRAAIYVDALEQLAEDLPYIWLYQGNVMVAAQPNLENWDPYPVFFNWNEDAWSVNN